MARSTPQRTLEDVRRSVARIQIAGERLTGRLRRDARSLLERGRNELVKDLRGFRREVRSRAEQVRRDLEKRVTKQLHAARAERVATLEKRVAKLAARVETLERKLAAGRPAA